MKRKISLLIVISIFVSMMLQPLLAIQNIENKQLDVVLVLDQSGSMKKNDPHGLMKEAAKTLVTMMHSNSRTNVITFNRSRSKWKEGLTSLSSESQTKSATDWINSVEYTGDTDLGNAVSEAVAMFDEDDGRIHAVLVFSDGKNDFGIEKNKEKESDERLSDALVTAKNTGVQIYCIGYGSEMADLNDRPYQKLDSIAVADSKNRITTKTDASSINDYFNLVVAELMGSNTVAITNNKVNIAPNVKEANINITCNEKIANANIRLIAPDGKEIVFKNNDNAKLFTYDSSAVIKLYKPVAGIYTIKTNNNIKISATYIPYYEYTLKSVILDNNGKEITQLNNGQTATIKTIIQQDNKDVTTTDTYLDLNAAATITAKDTNESNTVKLSYTDGSLIGEIKFDHVATYHITINIEAQSFKLVDEFEIVTNKQPISLKQQTLDKQTLDKTFKKSDTKTISIDTLKNIIADPDNIGFEIINVTSNDDFVEAKLTNKGLILTGSKWGSSNVTVTYKDKLGNEVNTSFAVKVTDKALLAFYASLPIFIGLIILLIILMILRQSRIIKGKFTINNITIDNNYKTLAITTIKTYPSNVFLARKKTLATGLAQYAKDMYNSSYNDKTEMLYNLMHQDTEIKKALESFKFIGTYLGRHGCKINVKNPNISYGNNLQYGLATKDNWRTDKDFTVYIKDDQGLEICITGHYSPSFISKKASFDADMEMFTSDNKEKESFDDFDDFTF